MKSIEKMRNELDERCKKGYVPLSQTRDLWNLIGEIEAELEERYIELPKDADGNYVHVGDVLTDDRGNSIEVSGFNSGSMVFYDTFYGGTQYKMYARTFLTNYRKHREDSWEQIINDAGVVGRDWFDKKGNMGTDEHAKLIDALISRCKALAKE